TAIFVGDLIDRGTEQLRVLEVAKAMADAGTAQVVMGNHEFNAIAYATESPAGSAKYLRPHTDKNDNQHRAFLEQLSGAQRAQYLDWFMT
ncbi:metallophosphatase, partial [Mycobacterium sp. ITM-2017-0098]